VLLEAVSTECAEQDGRGAVDCADLPECLGVGHRGGLAWAGGNCNERGIFVCAIGGHLRMELSARGACVWSSDDDVWGWEEVSSK
jgi:hypothetical protein